MCTGMDKGGVTASFLIFRNLVMISILAKNWVLHNRALDQVLVIKFLQDLLMAVLIL